MTTETRTGPSKKALVALVVVMAAAGVLTAVASTWAAPPLRPMVNYQFL